MKLKLFIFTTFIAFLATNAFASENVGIRLVVTNGKVRCGADLSTKTYAYQDSNGYWRGIGVDFCKIFAKAILNNSEAFDIVDTNEGNMGRYITDNKIDIMFGVGALNASRDVASKISEVGIVLYDKQAVLVKKIDGATTIEGYKNERMCIVAESFDLYNMQKYIETFGLEIKLLPNRNRKQTREAFLLNRCSMITDSKSQLNSLLKNSLEDGDKYEVLPENIALKPIYAFVKKENTKFRTLSEWIINSIKLAEENEISSQNIDIIIGAKDPSIQNLLGDNENLWKSFDLTNAKWVREIIKEVGNYGEIFERNFGEETEFKLDRNENNLYNKGGLILPRPFL